MKNPASRWLVPVVALVLGGLVTAATLSQGASWAGAGLSAAFVFAYATGLWLLQSRSETASLLAGNPIDERWKSINQQALAFAGSLMAAILVLAFVVVEFRGGDALPYAWLATSFAVLYLGGIAWFRWRS